jgi:Outer membrane protein beta-barrel domain
MLHQKLRILILLILVCCSFSKPLSAQDYREGFVIMNNNDSISGFVGYRAGNKNLGRCTFKANRKSTAVNYSALEIKSYGFYGDKKYISLSHSDEAITDEKIFVRVLSEGPIDLYRYGELFLIKKDNIVSLPIPKKVRIETEKGPMLKEDKRYVGILNQVLAECNLSANESAYAESDLTKLIDAYNQCKGLMPTSGSKKPIVAMNYQVFAGYIRSDMTMDLLNGVTFNPSYTVIGGLGADVSSPRIFDKLFFSFQAWYIKSLYQAYNQQSINGEIRHRDIFMEFTSIKVPVGVRFNFLRSNTPYIKAGFSTSFLLKNSIETMTEREGSSGDVITEESSGGYDLKDRPLGLWIGIGYDYTVHKNLRLFAELQYENANGFIGTAIQNLSNVNNLNFLLGLRF